MCYLGREPFSLPLNPTWARDGIFIKFSSPIWLWGHLYMIIIKKTQVFLRKRQSWVISCPHWLKVRKSSLASTVWGDRINLPWWRLSCRPRCGWHLWAGGLTINEGGKCRMPSSQVPGARWELGQVKGGESLVANSSPGKKSWLGRGQRWVSACAMQSFHMENPDSPKLV